MKKTLSILLALSATLLAAPPASAMYNVLLAGGGEANTIHIGLTADGRNYVIDSVVPLEVGGDLCANPEGNPKELLCPAPAIAGFEVNADGGDDKVVVSGQVLIPVTMRGGSGEDLLVGGKGADKLIGGAGDDRLVGGQGDDLIAGGSGDDIHVGGPGDDVILSGSGEDVVRPGRGDNVVKRVTGQPGARSRYLR